MRKNKNEGLGIGRFIAGGLSVLITIIIGALLDYWWMIPWNLQSSGCWWFTILMIVIGFALSILINFIYRKKHDGRYYDYDMEDIFDGNNNFAEKCVLLFQYYCVPFITLIFAILFVIVMVVTSFGGAKMFNADEYANLITVEEGNFKEDVVNVEEDIDSIVYVDQKTAQKLGDRTLGTVANPSWYEVDDEYNLVTINGEVYRISPVNYNGYFASKRVINNVGGIPGYVSVNVKTQEAEFVYFNEGEYMIYSPSGWFGKKLERHIHQAYPTYMLGTSFFEVDDENHPYWITEVKTKKIGLRGGEITNSFIITDANSGVMKEYKAEELPEWVDQAYSVGSLMEVIGWHYKYANGYFNISKTNLYKTTYSYKGSDSTDVVNDYTPFDGYNSAITKDGEIIFFTGITPDNEAETNIGFVSVSPRTGKVTFYPITGAEESSAQAAAEGLVSNLKYSASFPVIINVEGVETYFMVLKDQAGLVQRFALCNIANYAKCVEATSIEDAIEKYKIEIGLKAADDQIEDTDGDNEVEEKPIPPKDTTELTGIVTDVKEAQVDGYTYYYFTVEGSDIVFMSSIENSNMQPMKLVVGSNVTIKYYDSKESGIGIVTEISFN